MSERYNRHTLIPGWEQDRLSTATAIVVGVGAIGNEVARLLAMAGVGRLVLCDPDTISESNLSRTVLFRPEDVARAKVEVAAEALRQLVPGIVIAARPLPLIRGVGLAELRDASLVLGCLDSRAARLQLAGRCNLVGSPLIDGGTSPWGGEVRIYLDPEGPCYGCSLTAEQRATVDDPWSCVDVLPEEPQGASAPVSATIGALMGTAAVRHLMGLSTPEGVLAFDGSRGTTNAVCVARDPHCMMHSPLEPAERLAVSHRATIAALLSALPEGEEPLAWSPVMERVECLGCGYTEQRWGVPQGSECPECRMRMRVRTTLELTRIPGQLTLEQIGVAPREILAVRSEMGLRYVELAEREA